MLRAGQALPAAPALTDEAWLAFVALSASLELGSAAAQAASLGAQATGVALGDAAALGVAGQTSTSGVTAGGVGVTASGAGALVKGGLSLAVLKSLGLGVVLGVLGVSSAQLIASRNAPSPAAPLVSVSSAPVALRARSALRSPPSMLSSTPDLGASARAPSSRDLTAARTAAVRDTSSPASALAPTPAGTEASGPVLAPSASERSFEPMAQAAPSAQAERANELAVVAAQLATAKNWLAAGDGARAERLLLRSAAQFPVSALAEERELLLVQCEQRLGQGAAARARAERFLVRFAGSALAPSVRRAVGLPEPSQSSAAHAEPRKIDHKVSRE